MKKNILSFRLLGVAIALCTTLLAAGRGNDEFNLATYNIRYYAKSDSLRGDLWQTRCKVIADLVRFHDFDIFGTQEGLRHQLDDLKKNLPGYEYIGAGRDDGKARGEHAAIFYNTDIFDVVDHGHFWLSETPDKPGLGWDAQCYRICSWGKFKHKATGREFLYFNLHMDHIGKVARIESGKLIQRKIKEFGSDLPTFLSGDFNVDQYNECYQSICDSGVFNDSYAVADFVYDYNGTFNDWKANGFSPSRIDHIFVTPGIKVKKYGILTDSYRTTDDPEILNRPVDSFDAEVLDFIPRLPSDHFPIRITVSL